MAGQLEQQGGATPGMISARALALIGLFLVLLTVSFWQPICWMVERWLLKDSYYSHGFFVPVVALYFVWRDRQALRALPVERSLLGLAVMVAGLGILLVSGLIAVFFTAAFGMIFTIWGLVTFLFGLRVGWRLLFPTFLLLFMVPLPLQVIAEVSLRMKLMATQAAMALLDLCGIVATNDGSIIYMESGARVIVGNACSGLRSLISLIFLGVLFAYLAPLPPWRRVVLFLASGPIAIVANVVRVFLLSVVANQWGSAAIEGAVHDISGYLIFVVAFILLYGTSLLLGLGVRPPGAKDDDARRQPPGPLARSGPDSPHAAPGVPQQEEAFHE